MESIANVILLGEGVILLLLAYRCSGSVNAAPEDIPPGRGPSYVRLRRVFWIGMLLAMSCFLLAGLHVILRNAFLFGPAVTRFSLAIAIAVLFAIPWAAVEIRLDRKGYRLS